MHIHAPWVSFQMGIKIHFENAVGCVSVQGLTYSVQQLFVYLRMHVYCNVIWGVYRPTLL